MNNSLNKHYIASENNWQPIDALYDMGILPEFALGNVFKYISRAGKKPGQEVNDILKAIDYVLLFAAGKDINVSKSDIMQVVEARFKWIEDSFEEETNDGDTGFKTTFM